MRKVGPAAATVLEATYSGPDRALDPDVPTPVDVLGPEACAVPMSGEALREYANVLARVSPRFRVTRYGRSHGNRPLTVVSVGRPDRVADLDRVLGALTASGEPPFDPPPPDLPLSVWLGCGIHGDETSGGDAALAVLYRLAAGTDPETLRLLDRLLVHVDVDVNPDGRARHLAALGALRGRVATGDPSDLADLGGWPSGRGNHYLIDLNRDLILQTQPETRARTAALRRVSPQVVLELHEMEPDESFLFASPGAPLNSLLPDHVHRWWDRFGEEHGGALDRIGQPWYRGEWNEVFFPGYQDIWPAYLGAVPIIFEQARTAPGGTRGAGGRDRSYAAAVRNHAVSVFANLRAAADGASDLLEDWRAARRAAGAQHDVYLVRRTPNNHQRLDWLAECLAVQGIEVEMTTVDADDLPVGSLVIRAGQPAGRLVRVLLEADVPLPADFVAEERDRLERGLPSRLYDVTAWSPALVAGLEVRREPDPPDVTTAPAPGTSPARRTSTEEAAIGHLFHDEEFRMVPELLHRGLSVRLARRHFHAGGRDWSAGCALVRLDEQPPGVDPAQVLDELARRHHVEVIAVATARTGEGPDLGGREFAPLGLPVTCLLAGRGFDEPSFGALRHLLDVEVGVPAALAEPGQLADRGRHRPELILVPEIVGDPADVVGPTAAAWLGRWVANGGTLVTLGSSAALPATLGIGATTMDTDGRRWLPSGAVLEVDLATASPMLTGLEPSVPVLWRGAGVVRPAPAATVLASHARGPRLVRAGLVWKEAVDLLSDTPYLVVEPVGDGHVVTFASDPLWRGAARGSARLLLRTLTVPL